MPKLTRWKSAFGLVVALNVQPANAQSLLVETFERNLDEISDIVAKGTEPRVIEVPGNVPPQDAIFAKCNSTLAYQRILREAESIIGEEVNLLEVSPTAREITVPNCLPRSFDAFEVTQPKPPQVEPVWAEITGTTAEIARVSAMFRELDNTRTDFLSEPAFLIAPQDSNCSVAAEEGKWPFDPRLIIEQYAITAHASGEVGEAATIMILDAGFDEDLVPPAWTPIGKSMSKFRASNALANSPLGVNLARGEDTARTFENYSHRWHGYSVADVALGTHLLHHYRTVVPRLPKIAMASNLHDVGGSIRIASQALGEAYLVADRENIDIINVSFEFTSNLTSLRDSLSRHGQNILLVAAAGNNSLRLEDSLTWPARLGGRDNAGDAHAITVGAHEPDGKISDFSRYSKSYVDILAPGCDIPSVTVAAQNGGRSFTPNLSSGTSFAAPLVSFTAGLLSSFGLSPAEIKERIVVTADSDNSLRNKVFSSGRLNIEDALSFRFVVLKSKRTGSIERHLNDPLEFGPTAVLCGQTYQVDELLKVSKRPDEEDGSGNYLHIWYKLGQAQKLEYELCEQKQNDYLDLTLKPINRTHEITVGLDDIFDVIFQIR